MKTLNRGLQIGLPAVIGLTLLVFVIQNAKTTVTIILFGAAGEPVSLALVLIAAYLVGGGVGALSIANTRFHDYYLLRRARRDFVKEQTATLDPLGTDQAPSRDFVAKPYDESPLHFKNSSDAQPQDDLDSSQSSTDDEDWRPPNQWDY